MSCNQSLSVEGLALRSFVDVVRWRACHQPDRNAYTFLVDGEREEMSLTYAELDTRARAIGQVLQSLCPMGARALLLAPPGLEYIAAFLGCLYAGVVAVPAYPPKLNRPDSRLRAIVADAQATVALTTSVIQARMERHFVEGSGLETLQWIPTDCVVKGTEQGWQEPPLDLNTLALLQYTSGSTATPKGVMLTHSNLLHNGAMIRQHFQHTPNSRGLLWLPPYHDMGLIGGILQPLYGGMPMTFLSPGAFLQHPVRWLEAISRTQSTISGGPSFAYDLCARKITPEQCAGLDLSSWDLAFIGAEPISYETVERFTIAFAPYGFRREAFYPCYGLAEATLLVAGGKKSGLSIPHPFQEQGLRYDRAVEPSSRGEGVRFLVEYTPLVSNQQLVIVDPESHVRCPDDAVGEIWVAGPSVAQGYWNRPEETISTFQAYLADTGEGPFLRTGDLGFLGNSNLFITGRLKDLIIIHGQNHYPQDIENTAGQCSPLLRPGCGAAFSVEVAGEERLVIVHEVEQRARKADVEQVAGVIRQAVLAQHEILPFAVVLARVGSIPKTTSGKIQRSACRAKFLAGELDSVGSSVLNISALLNDTSRLFREELLALGLEQRKQLLEADLHRQVANLVGVAPSRVNAHLPLHLLLDSLKAAELACDIDANLEVTLPIVSLLQGATIAQVSAEILAHLATSAVGRTHKAAAGSTIPGAAHVFPLSSGQRALWFLSQLAPESVAYNLSGAVRIKNALDSSSLRRVFQALVARHPSLRTTFTTLHGQPVQKVHKRQEVFFMEEDVSGWNKKDLDAHLAEEVHRPFDLERGPLLRVFLFTCSKEEHILLVVLHHLITDFWSLAILMQELGDLYKAEQVGLSIHQPPLSKQYSDYVYWQEDMMASKESERLWAYWREELAGELPILDLPTDRPRPPIQTYRGASETLLLGPELTQRLKAFQHQEGMTLYMVLLAAFTILLYRYTGQEDLIIGSPTNGRNLAEFAQVVGYFVNPVALRADASGNPSFRTFLSQVRRKVLAALEYQAYPFDMLVQRLQPARDPSRSPLFQVMFVWQQAPQHGAQAISSFTLGESWGHLDLGGLSVDSLAIQQRIAKLDLTLTMAEVESGLGASLEYNSALFDKNTIRRMLGHLQHILEGIAADPNQSISDLPLLSPEERQQVLVNWNATASDYPYESTITQLFEEQVIRTPEAVAAVFERQRYTYRELNARANQLAHYLRGLGIGPEVRVGLRMERSLEMIVSLLGILKAGGAYIPLDPAYPQERLEFILEDAQVLVLVTDRQIHLPQRPLRLLSLVQERETIAQGSQENLSVPLVPTNLAYVIYTSGSTGVPKGVAIEHKSAVAFLDWVRRAFTPQDLSGVLASTSICFDLSVFELFGPLSWGGKVILAEHALSLPQVAAATEVTLINTVPSIMSELIKRGELPSSVRTVNLAGEVLPGALVELIYKYSQVSKVFNLYGPTEDTTYTTCALVEKGTLREPGIGHPITNKQIYVLDPLLQPVAVGVPGELYIGGVGLARGYLHRPELTAHYFIPNPFHPGTRLYKTGDRVRYLPDGTLEFLGRLDQQVKLRGFRIELGEIEMALRQHPLLREAVVTPYGGKLVDKQLVAYVVADRKPGPSISELQHFLKKKLPPYMRPSSFVYLDGLPLLPNGKVNRKALPAPGAPEHPSNTSVARPRNPLEELLCRLCAQVLQIDEVGIHDSFFELGGASLQAIQLITLANEAGLDLTPEMLFEHETVADLAIAYIHIQEAQRDDPLRRRDVEHLV